MWDTYTNFKMKKNKNIIIGYVGATMDLFHYGHARLLERAKQYCDWLIVILNTDGFVAKFKGTSPIMSLEERIEMVEYMKVVDYVGVNESGEDSKPMLLKYKPDIIFVGDDYDFDSYCEQMQFDVNWLTKHHIRVMFFPYTKEISSTDIKKRILKRKL